MYWRNTVAFLFFVFRLKKLGFLYSSYLDQFLAPLLSFSFHNSLICFASVPRILGWIIVPFRAPRRCVISEGPRATCVERTRPLHFRVHSAAQDPFICCTGAEKPQHRVRSSLSCLPWVIFRVLLFSRRAWYWHRRIRSLITVERTCVLPKSSFLLKWWGQQWQAQSPGPIVDVMTSPGRFEC